MDLKPWLVLVPLVLVSVIAGTLWARDNSEMARHLFDFQAVESTAGWSALAACSAARKAGVQVVTDADSFHEGLVELARWSDFFISSENFASALIKKEDPREACRRIADLGPKVAGVTLGARGYVALAEGRWIEKPAYPVEAVDTTGCGDVFHAGFIFGLLQGWAYEKCFDFAAWAAAMVSLKMGGRSGIPSLVQVRERGFLG